MGRLHLKDYPDQNFWRMTDDYLRDDESSQLQMLAKRMYFLENFKLHFDFDAETTIWMALQHGANYGKSEEVTSASEDELTQNFMTSIKKEECEELLKVEQERDNFKKRTVVIKGLQALIDYLTCVQGFIHSKL